MASSAFYDADVVDLRTREADDSNRSTVRIGGRRARPSAPRRPCIASGGFEANLDWLREAWGDAADNFIIRGTPYNTGMPLKRMLDAGAQPVGDPRECHAIAVDARAPKFDGGIVTRLDCIPFGIVVNSEGHRFYDEGEDLWPKRYAIWGKLIARQPDADRVFDRRCQRRPARFMPSVFPPIVANSIGELARLLDPPACDARGDRRDFQRRSAPWHAQPRARSTIAAPRDSVPNKTHWAQRLDTPPYWAYPLRPGITFTYLGLKVDAHARVLMSDGQPAANVYAAGEVMAGNILRKGYLAGFGMTIGTVFGRIAGEEAARHAAR